MSKIKLYHLCYKKEQIAYISSHFSVWNNLENKNPPLREYPILREAYFSNETKNLKIWGIVSPKFEEKTNLSGNAFMNFILQNPSRANVFFINPYPICEAIFPNIFYQGEIFHTGIMDLFSRTLQRMGYNFNAKLCFMDVNVFALCNFFCGDKIFWKAYIKFVDAFIQEVKKDPEDYIMMFHKSAKYSFDASLPYYPFVVERLFSTFLVLHPEIKPAAYRYTMQELIDKTKLTKTLLNKVNKLTDNKLAVKTLEDKCLYSLTRNELIKKNPILLYK